MAPSFFRPHPLKTTSNTNQSPPARSTDSPPPPTQILDVHKEFEALLEDLGLGEAQKEGMRTWSEERKREMIRARVKNGHCHAKWVGVWLHSSGW